MKDIGERLTSYEPLWENWYKDSYLGSGGSGKVYKFRQELYGQVRYCAVKVLPIILDRSVSVTRESREQEMSERKKQVAEEIKNMYRLGDKPHLVHCINHTYRDIIGDDGDVIGFDVLIQMEYYKTLTEYINTKGNLPPAEIEKLAFHIGEALCAMHEINMLHRDIKPDNIYVDDKGDFYLGDFGIAKQTRAGSFATFVGTQPFMAPEVWNARTPGEQHYGTSADIYSLGITLYYLLNEDRLPLVNAGDNRNAVDAAIFARLSGKNVPAPVNGSEALKQLVMDCCAFDPADRIQDAEKFLAALGKCVSSPQIINTSDTECTADDTSQVNDERSVNDIDITDSIFMRPGDEEEEELIVRPAPARPERRKKQLPAKAAPKAKEPAHLSKATKRKALVIGLTLCCILCIGSLFLSKVICIHHWQAATCTTQETCLRCGKKRGKLASHDFEEATCTHPRRCRVCGKEEGSKLDHVWKQADCDHPKTCTVCGKTEGDALGHKWKDAECEMPQYCEVCGLIGQEELGHKWKEATCTTPMTCERCKKTEGKPIGHKWKNATCTEPETCENCGETRGKAKGHTWTEATLTKPKTCSVCGTTEGTALNYTSKGTMYVDTDGGSLALREEKSSSSKQLASIPDCTPIQIWYTGSSAWYYTVYNNTYGYVNSYYISSTDPMLGDGNINGWSDTGYMDELEVTVDSAEIKGNKLTVELTITNTGSDFLWPDLYIYYNGSENAKGNLIEATDIIIMPYGERTVTASCRTTGNFGRGSLKNIVVVDGSGNKVLLEP